MNCTLQKVAESAAQTPNTRLLGFFLRGSDCACSLMVYLDLQILAEFGIGHNARSAAGMAENL